MAKPISLFSGYNQKENRVTNYCLLILRMIYEENPKYLAEVLSGLLEEDMAGRIGVSFSQQQRESSSVPDGVIFQEAITIFIETKNWDWFSDAQLESHLASLSERSHGLKILLALGAFEGNASERFRNVYEICRAKYSEQIQFAAVTFEDLIAALQIDGLPKNLADAIAELRAFLDENNLLPRWRDILDVVNCAGKPDDILVGGVYMCPASGGSYSHARCAYFGMYRKKKVEYIASIEAVVEVEHGSKAQVRWLNSDKTESEACEEAQAKVEELRPDAGATRVFLLGPLSETEFIKDSKGGLRGSKQYFDISRISSTNAAELAAALQGRHWSDFL